MQHKRDEGNPQEDGEETSQEDSCPPDVENKQSRLEQVRESGRHVFKMSKGVKYVML